MQYRMQYDMYLLNIIIDYIDDKYVSSGVLNVLALFISRPQYNASM